MQTNLTPQLSLTSQESSPETIIFYYNITDAEEKTQSSKDISLVIWSTDYTQPIFIFLQQDLQTTASNKTGATFQLSDPRTKTYSVATSQLPEPWYVQWSTEGKDTSPRNSQPEENRN